MSEILSDFTSGWQVPGVKKSWESSGGDPGGYLGWSSPGNASGAYVAPSKFLGHQGAYYGGDLSFDIFASQSDDQSGYFVALSDGTRTILAAASKEIKGEIREILFHLELFEIRATYSSAKSKGGLDNVLFQTSHSGSFSVMGPAHVDSHHPVQFSMDHHLALV